MQEPRGTTGGGLLLGRTSSLDVGVLCPTLGPPAKQQQQAQGMGDSKWQSTAYTIDLGKDSNLMLSIAVMGVSIGTKTARAKDHSWP